jgi:hypothetical protein
MSINSFFNRFKTQTPHGKKMHVKEIYVIFIHLFDSRILLIIDLNKKKGKKGGGVEFYLLELPGLIITRKF